MKKIYALLSLLTLVFAAQAQTGFDIGVSGTFSSTWIYTQNNYGTLAPFQNPVIRTSEMDYLPTWGGNGGITLGYNFNRFVGLKVELQYSTAGQKYEDNFEGPATIPEGTFGSPSERVNVKRQIKLSYFQIPLLVKVMTKKGRVAKFFAAIGPQFGFRTFAQENVQVAGFEYVYSPTANFKTNEKFRTFDMGIALQLGTDIYCTDHLYVEVGLNVYQGLTDINGKKLQDLGWYSQNDVEYHRSYNARFGLMVGLHYIIGRGREDY